MGLRKSSNKASRNALLGNSSMEYKRAILLSIAKLYPDVEAAVNDGYDEAAINNAISVLRDNGFNVDMKNAIIEKA